MRPAIWSSGICSWIALAVCVGRPWGASTATSLDEDRRALGIFIDSTKHSAVCFRNLRHATSSTATRDGCVTALLQSLPEKSPGEGFRGASPHLHLHAVTGSDGAHVEGVRTGIHVASWATSGTRASRRCWLAVILTAVSSFWRDASNPAQPGRLCSVP